MNKIQLKKQIEKIKGLDFPLNSSDPLISEIHAQLAEYDTHIMGIAQSVLTQEDFEHKHRRVEKDLYLIDTINNMLSLEPYQNNKILLSIKMYLSELINLVQLLNN